MIYLIPTYFLSLLVPNLVLDGAVKYLPAIISVVGGNLYLVCKYKYFPRAKEIAPFSILLTFVFAHSLLSFSTMEGIKVLLLLLHACFVFNLVNVSDEILHKSIRTSTYLLLPLCFVPIFSKDNYLQSVFLYRNDFAAFAAVLIFLIDLSWSNKKRKYLFLFLLVVVTLFTKSRSTYVFLIVYFGFKGFFTITALKLSYKKAVAFLFLILTSAGYFTILGNPGLVEKLNKLPTFNLHSDKKLYQLSGRDALYQGAIKILAKHPYGVGEVVAKKHFKEIGGVATPHNIYLKFLVEYGWHMTIMMTLSLAFFFWKIDNNLYLVFVTALLSRGLFEGMLPLGFSFFTAFLVAPYLAKIKEE
jgi:hypothetical protein